MFEHTGRVFEIYSIGDGLYMQRILNAVAAMSNSGMLLKLVSLGLLIGLLVMGVRNVMAGGNKLELGTTLASLLLAVFLFGLKADVAVMDMSYVPGQRVQGDFTVDNVPFGIAAVGSVVSGIGYTLTERMEQAYSVPGMESMGMAKGGFGKTLEWISSIRLWETPIVEPGGGGLKLWRDNLDAYMAECTVPGLQMGHLSLDAIRKAADPLTLGNATSGGIGYASVYLMVQLKPSVAAAPQAYTCRDGFAVLVGQKADGYEGFVRALGSVFKDGGGETSGGDSLRTAYSAIGYNTSDVQNVVLAASVGQSLTTTLGNAKEKFALGSMNQLMIEQASLQRTVQWAAEETMFRRIMRPMMAFFECLIYALAPFMALAVGLGSFGMQTVFKYMMLSIWVSLWMPVLSIIQLYQITALQHAVEGMNAAMLGSTNIGPTSIASAELLRSQAMEWLSTGSALAAWTPAITMALVWSGSVTASALAGKLQGGDHINERMSAPDTTNAPSAIQVGSRGEASYAQGMTDGGSGSSVPSLNMASVSQMSTASTNARMQSASSEYASAVQQAYRETYGASNGFSATTGSTHTGEASSTLRGSAENSVSNSSGSRKQVDDAVGVTSTQGASHSVDGKASGGLEAFGIGGTVSTTGSNRESQEVSQARRGLESAVGDATHRAGVSQGWDGSSGQRLQESVGRLAKADANFAKALERSSSVSNAQRGMEQASQAYQESSSFGQSYGMSQSVPLTKLATQANQEGRGGDLASAVVAGGLSGAAQAKYNQLPMISNEQERRAAANIAALYDGAQEGTSKGATPQQAALRASLLVDALSGEAGSGSFVGGFEQSKNQGVASGAPDFDAVKQKGESAQAPTRSSGAATEQQVMGAVGGNQGVQSQMMSEAQQTVSASPGSFASGQPVGGDVHAQAPGAGEAWMGAVAQEAKDNISDNAAGMDAQARNAVANDTNLDTAGRITMGRADSAMGAMPESLGSGQTPVQAELANLQRQNPNLDSGMLETIAVGRVLETQGPQAVTQGEFNRADNFVKSEGSEGLLNTFGAKQGGAAAMFAQSAYLESSKGQVDDEAIGKEDDQ